MNERSPCGGGAAFRADQAGSAGMRADLLRDGAPSRAAPTEPRSRRGRGAGRRGWPGCSGRCVWEVGRRVATERGRECDLWIRAISLSPKWAHKHTQLGTH